MIKLSRERSKSYASSSLGLRRMQAFVQTHDKICGSAAGLSSHMKVYRIYTPMFFKWLSIATWCKYSRNIRSIIHLFLKQKALYVGKLISFGNLLDREITRLESPCIWFCPAQNKSRVWSLSRDRNTYIYFILSIASSLISSLPRLATHSTSHVTWKPI